MSLVANLPKIGLPDGVASLHYDPSVVLIADTARGLIWKVNTATGGHEIAIDDPSFKPTKAVPLGVNGIHILRDQLYFTNLATNSVGRLTITTTGDATGRVQLIASAALFADDFALADDGTVYAAGFNTLRKITADGRTVSMAGAPNSSALQGITSARFGRTQIDQDVIYMATEGGGMLNDPSGLVVHGGQLLAINLKMFD